MVAIIGKIIKSFNIPNGAGFGDRDYWVVTVTKAPQLAPRDYKKLKMWTENSDGGVGSGINTEDHIYFKNRKIKLNRYYQGAAYEEYRKKELMTMLCGNCKSSNVLLIYLYFCEDLVDKVEKYELKCQRCKLYTQYDYVK